MDQPTSSRTKARPLTPPKPFARPPVINAFDHRIRLKNGFTSVLDFSIKRLENSKCEPTLQPPDRIAELTRELGQLRYEIHFYRTCFEILQRLRETAYDVYQQLFLAHYFESDPKRLDELIVQLHHGLEDSVRRERGAEKCWMEFWGIETDDQGAEGELI